MRSPLGERICRLTPIWFDVHMHHVPILVTGQRPQLVISRASVPSLVHSCPAHVARLVFCRQSGGIPDLVEGFGQVVDRIRLLGFFVDVPLRIRVETALIGSSMP